MKEMAKLSQNGLIEGINFSASMVSKTEKRIKNDSKWLYQNPTGRLTLPMYRTKKAL